MSAPRQPRIHNINQLQVHNHNTNLASVASIASVYSRINTQHTMNPPRLRLGCRHLARVPRCVHHQTTISTRCSSSSAVSRAEANYKIIDRAADFEKKQASRPAFDHSRAPIRMTKQPSPQWEYGDGVPGRDLSLSHREVDPYAANRAMVDNYKLLISAIAPRPIGLISTRGKDGSKNLAPFSYFQVVDHDPPTFIVGFSSRPGAEKDTFRNLQDTGECVVNTVSEDMIEAVNAVAVDAPHGVSEWDISGLHEAETSVVRAARVRESVFSAEAEVVDVKVLGGEKEGMSSAGVVMLRAVRFWVRDDATDEEVKSVDLDVLRPIAQLGGMAYGRIKETFELPRRRWVDEVGKSDKLAALVEEKTN